jgi:Spy/CpxP family protein refolding chaperone
MRLHLRILALAIWLPIALTFATVSSAGMDRDHPHGFGGRDHGPERFIEQHADELDLSPETRAAIENIATDSRARAEALRERS